MEEEVNWLLPTDYNYPDYDANQTTNDNDTNSSTATDGAAANVENGGRNEDIATLEMALLSVMFVIAVFGNCLVLVALIVRRKKLTRMYYFILHLCISDLIVAFFHILPQLCWEITYRFKGNNFLCKVTKFTQLVGPYLSSYVLVATAIDRYLAICFPLVSNNLWSARHSRMMVWVAWVVALLLALPQMFIFSYQDIGKGVFECWGDFVEPYGQVAYITFYTIANTLLPLCVLLYTYSAICWAVYVNFRNRKSLGATSGCGQMQSASSCTSLASSNRLHTSTSIHNGVAYRFKVGNRNGTTDEENRNTLTSATGHLSAAGNYQKQLEKSPINPRIHSNRGISRAKIKTVKLTIVVIACYIFCSMPYSCVMLWTAYSPNAAQSPFYQSTWYALMTLLASLNSCVNPWIYLAFNSNLLESIRRIFGCSSRDDTHPGRMSNVLTTNASRTSLSDSGLENAVTFNAGSTDERRRSSRTLGGSVKSWFKRRRRQRRNRRCSSGGGGGPATSGVAGKNGGSGNSKKVVGEEEEEEDLFVDERTRKLLLQPTPTQDGGVGGGESVEEKRDFGGGGGSDKSVAKQRIVVIVNNGCRGYDNESSSGGCGDREMSAAEVTVCSREHGDDDDDADSGENDKCACQSV